MNEKDIRKDLEDTRNPVRERPLFFHSSVQEQKRIVSEFRSICKVHPLHWHDYIEVEIVSNGSGEQIYNGHPVPFERGLVSVMRLSDYHKLIPGEGLSIINISFEEDLLPPDLLERLWSTKGICKKFKGVRFEAIEGIAKLMVGETENDAGDLTVATKLLECLFIKILEDIDDAECSSEPTPIQYSIQYIRSHFKQSPTLPQVAQFSHYDPKYFCTLFRRETGMTYNDYLKRLKINYAKKLLLTTDLSIDYISIESGFGSPSNFRRTFKEVCGVTPTRFRRPKKKTEYINKNKETEC